MVENYNSVPEDFTSSSGLRGHCIHVHRQTCRQNTHTGVREMAECQLRVLVLTTHAQPQMLAVKELGKTRCGGFGPVPALALVQPEESGVGTPGCSLQETVSRFQSWSSALQVAGSCNPFACWRAIGVPKCAESAPFRTRPGLSPVRLVHLSQDCLLPLLYSLKLRSCPVTCFCCVLS